MNKKGNINQLFPAVLALILVGALIGIGILILESFQNTTYLSTAQNVVNETTTTTVNETGVNLATYTLRTVACSIGTVTNATSGTTINAGNYTATNCNIRYSGQSNTAGFNNSLWNVSYTYTFDNATATTNAIGSTNTSLSSLASTWLPIIVVVLVAGIVLSILLGAFAGKKK